MTADPWPDDIIRLLREPAPARVEPTATEAAAYVGVKIAEYGAYLIILAALAGCWIITP